MQLRTSNSIIATTIERGFQFPIPSLSPQFLWPWSGSELAIARTKHVSSCPGSRPIFVYKPTMKAFIRRSTESANGRGWADEQPLCLRLWYWCAHEGKEVSIHPISVQVGSIGSISYIMVLDTLFNLAIAEAVRGII